VAAAVAAAGPAVDAAVPGLGAFTVSFVGLVGAMVVLAVARVRRVRVPLAAPTLLVTGAVAAAVTMTVIFLLRDPAAVFFVPAFAAGWVGRSFRTGLRAGIWAGIASLPLTYALWLHEALRLYAINGGLPRFSPA
jgi:hypothetical protein